MKEWFKNIVRIGNTARLYIRVGTAGLTIRKFYVLVRYWFLTAILRKHIPWLIELSVTYRCQCRCKHCSVSNYFTEADRARELSYDDIVGILKDAVKMGIPKIDYFGGEPLIKERIVDLVREASQLGIYISVTTNGLMLTQQMIRDLKAAGISCINISLDSASQEEHDRLRGKDGLYDKVITAIKDCHDAGVACIVSTYVTRRRINNFATAQDDSELTAIIDLSKSLKATGIRILFPIISGEWEKKKEIELNDSEKKRVIENIDHSFAFIEGAYSVVQKKKTCQALSGKLINISPYGDMQLCIAFPKSFGNLKELSLKELMHKMWEHPIYQKNKNSDCCSTEGLKT
ncbi:radical SAM/SPASM domain-containing protein [Candidatus Omnitrophota bacterium]